ncbi:antitoxin Xre/MbcA/ParS toxin-binding domain-containing protein [Paraburkholderia atlantica]|uniref:antitoxin Xre/MbcA/ParS toxin-binding domain-containing protein n=1 Tax=Paraburkholderia atlantica TaxID=2654982 RepID=UPI0009FC1B08
MTRPAPTLGCAARSPHPELGGKTPYEAAATDVAGAELVEAVLGRILHGIPT